MKKSYILAGISILCWSTAATVAKVLVTDLPNMQVLFISSAVAFLFLLLFNIKRKNLHIIRSYTHGQILTQISYGILGIFYAVFFAISV